MNPIGDPPPRSVVVIALAAMLPFWVAAGAALWPQARFGLAEAVILASAYGAVVLAFLGGGRWGAAAGPFEARRIGLDTALAILPVPAGFLALLLPPIPGLGVLIAGFLLIGLWDMTSAHRGQVPRWFAHTRLLAIAVAVAGLVVVLAALVLTHPG